MSLLRIAFTLLLTGLSPLLAANDHPWIGKSPAEIEAFLGEPRGTIEGQGLRYSHYPSHRIAYQNDRATRIEPLPLSQAETAQQMRLRVAQQREALGSRLARQYRYSPALAALPPSKQLQFWVRFQANYPETDVSKELEAARTRVLEHQADQRAQEQAEKLALLDASLEPQSAPKRSGVFRGFFNPYYSGHFHRQRHFHSDSNPPSRGSEQPPAPIRPFEAVFRTPAPVTPMLMPRSSDR